MAGIDITNRDSLDRILDHDAIAACSFAGSPFLPGGRTEPVIFAASLPSDPLSPPAPPYRETFASMALILEALGAPEAGQTALTRALDQGADLAAAAMDLGIAFAQGGCPSAAASLFRRVILLLPAHAEAHARLGEVLAAQHRFEDGLEALENARHLDPLRPETHLSHIQVLNSLGRSETAEACCREALVLLPRHVPLRCALAQLLLSRGRAGEAAELFEQARALEPKAAEAHHGLVAALQALDLPALAARALVRFSHILTDAGDASTAALALRRAAALDPALDACAA